MNPKMEKYKNWFHECMVILDVGADTVEAHFNDPNWLTCFDEGFTPEQAVGEFITHSDQAPLLN